MKRVVTSVAVVAGALMFIGVSVDFVLEAFAPSSDGPLLALIASLFYPDAEANVSVWISTLVLAAVAMGFAVIGGLTRANESYPWRYAILASVALLLSI